MCVCFACWCWCFAVVVGVAGLVGLVSRHVLFLSLYLFCHLGFEVYSILL